MKGSSSRNGGSGEPGGSEIRRALTFVLAGYRRVLAVTAGASFLGGLAEAVFLVTITRLAFAISEGDREVGIVAGRVLSVNQTLGFAVALVVIRVVLAGLAVWQTSRVAASVVARLRRRLTRAFLRSSWEVQQAQQGGSLQQLVDGYTSQASATMTGVSSGVVAAANLVAMLALAVAVDLIGSVVMLLSIVVFALALRPIRQLVRRRADESNAARMNLAVSVNETSQLGMELHVFNVQSEAVNRLDDYIDAAREKTRRLQFAHSSMSTVYSALAYVAMLLALGVVAQSDAADLKSVGAVMLVMLRSLSYGQAVQVAYLGIVGSSPAIRELTERLDDFERNRRSDGGQPVGSIERLDVSHVSFAYPDGDQVLHDISFRLDPHEIVGIVGPSGGGKSTLVQLLLGLRDPDDGTILADGRDIGSFAKHEWARKVTFVPQTAHLVAGTIADNIRFMRDGIDDDEVKKAARLAHLHDEVIAFPEGYDRPVGESGSALSGGQQQRLCIARALVEDPDLLILDEPTSALDVKSEHLVRSTLLALRERMTVVVIAHRLSTLDICDRIMVIQGGRLVGFDRPDRLQISNEFYREALELSGLS